MQLKPIPVEAGDVIAGQRASCKRKIVSSLAAAACSLLGTTQGPSIAQEDSKWKFDTALLYYGETDRVDDLSANFVARRRFRSGQAFSFRVSVDTLTGSSANGAVPANAPQTFTSPSGNDTYTTDAAETPLDPTFLDTRVALSGNWTQPLGRRSEVKLGISLSDEYDYFHAGINAEWSRDFNERNTTLNLGLAFASDTIDPEGGAPIPLAPMLPEGDTSNKEGDDDKTVTDVMVGVTQVIGRRTIGQLNYAVSHSSGYLTDPYKLVSVVDPVTGDPTPGPGGLNLYRFENRPDSRTKHSLFGRVKHHLRRDLLDVSYRFMTDDWDVQSHTVDFRYRWNLGRVYLQPHLRFYTQSETDFYERVLFDGKPPPDEVTADYRLGELDTYTIGLKFGHPLGDGMEWNLRVEYYNQSGTSPPDADVGSLRGFDLFEDVDAVIVQLGYHF